MLSLQRIKRLISGRFFRRFIEINVNHAEEKLHIMSLYICVIRDLLCFSIYLVLYYESSLNQI